MNSNQSTTLSMLVIVGVLAVALGRPTRGFWSALFTHRPVSFELAPVLKGVPNMQDPTSTLTPDQIAGMDDAIGARKPSWSVRRP